MELLSKSQGLAFEIDELIQHASMGGHTLYQKGIALIAHEPRLIQLGELMVEHPGLDMTRSGMVTGWFYSVDDEGIWKRIDHASECVCGHSEPHMQHISALHIIEHYLSNPSEFDD